jgi:hypothetical protein
MQPLPTSARAPNVCSISGCCPSKLRIETVGSDLVEWLANADSFRLTFQMTGSDFAVNASRARCAKYAEPPTSIASRANFSKGSCASHW